MRKYICVDCGTSWQVVFGEEIPGIKQACPKCKSLKVILKGDKHKWDQDDRGIHFENMEPFEIRRMETWSPLNQQHSSTRRLKDADSHINRK